MPVYRYRRVLTITGIDGLIPDTPTSIEETPQKFIDIDVAASSKADLDDIMVQRGFVFVEEAPSVALASAAQEQSIGEVIDLTGISDGDVLRFDTGSDAFVVMSPAAAGSIEPDDAAAAGSAESYSRSDHQHAIATAPAGTIEPGDAAGEGSAVTFARSDHQHAVAAGVPGSIQPDDAALEGTSPAFARADHVHSIVTAAPAQGVGAGNTEGTAVTFARSDHDHTIRESGGQDLTVGSLSDGDVVVRSGNALSGQVGAVPKDHLLVSEDSRTTTTSTRFQDKVTAVTGPLTGTYLVTWKAVVDNSGAEGRYRLRNDTDSITIDGDVRWTSPDSSNRMSVGGFATIVLSGTSKDIALQFRDAAGGNTQGIRLARIEMHKVAD